jgi:hypothetical protein
VPFARLERPRPALQRSALQSHCHRDNLGGYTAKPADYKRSTMYVP